MQLALDESNNDLIKLPSGGVARVDKGRYTIQLVRCKLQTMLGEWALDESLGFINLENDLTRNYNLFDLELRANTIILGCVGVKSVIDIKLVVVKRKLTLTFSADTIYGIIDLTIEW